MSVQGSGSSIQARLKGSSARPILIASSAVQKPSPKWSMQSEISVADRLADGAGDVDAELDAGLADARAGAAAGGEPLLVLRVLVPGRLADQRAGRPLEEARPEVELDEGEAERLALHHHLDEALGRQRPRRRGVAVEAHLVAVLAAEELVARHAVDLADEIHQRDLDAADAAGLAAVAAVVRDHLEQVVDVAGVLPEQQVLEPQRRVGAGAVAHLAEAVDALVGVDPEDGVVAVAEDRRDPEVGDAQRARARGRADVVGDRFDRRGGHRIPLSVTGWASRLATPICSMMCRPDPSTWLATMAAAPSASCCRSLSISSRCSRITA